MSNSRSHDRINERISPRKRKKGGKTPLLVAVSVVLIFVVLICITVALGGKKDSDISGKNVVVTPENVEEKITEMESQKVQAGTYNVTMNPTWTFENGSSTSKDAYVENSVLNNNDVYFTVSLKGTEEVICTSPVIPLGSRLANITLDKALPAGSHDCVITYHLLDTSGNETTSVNIGLNIVVEN